MAIEILTDRDTNQSVMFCNTSEMAFGPVFGEDEDPLEFLEWLKDEDPIFQGDARRLDSDDLSLFVDQWRNVEV